MISIYEYAMTLTTISFALLGYHLGYYLDHYFTERKRRKYWEMHRPSGGLYSQKREQKLQADWQRRVKEGKISNNYKDMLKDYGVEE